MVFGLEPLAVLVVPGDCITQRAGEGVWDWQMCLPIVFVLGGIIIGNNWQFKETIGNKRLLISS